MNGLKAEGKKLRHSFPKAARLEQKREFDAVFQKGGKGVGKALVVYARANDKGLHRLGLAVSKKNGNAVRRNRIRRLIREAFRLENRSWPGAYDLVFIPRPGGFPDHLAELLPEFRTTVQKAMRRLEGRK